MEYSLSVHDCRPPEESAVVDSGLGTSNDQAAPLHEVQAISCFVRERSGRVIGGAVGRWWGQCSELQQLWVEPSLRRQGFGHQLVKAFEARARTKGCTSIYLETFSFQLPGLYRRLGYRVEYERRCYPYGIVKYHMVKQLGGAEPLA